MDQGHELQKVMKKALKKGLMLILMLMLVLMLMLMLMLMPMPTRLNDFGIFHFLEITNSTE